MQDNQVLDQLKKGDADILETVYKEFREEFFSWAMGQYNCELEDAKDHYQFAILKLYENVVNGKLTELTSSIKTYLFAIGKNKILEAQKKAGRFIDQPQEIQLEVKGTDHIEKEKRLVTIERCLNQLGEPCSSLLKQYYYHKKSMDQLADLFNYNNRDTAKNVKFKCLQRLRKLVKEEYLKLA